MKLLNYKIYINCCKVVELLVKHKCVATRDNKKGHINHIWHCHKVKWDHDYNVLSGNTTLVLELD